MFKGPDWDIHAIFTSSSSASCGVTLEINKEYLFTGRLNTDGRMRIAMCDFIQYWEDLNGTQKKSLTQRYQSGCDCTVCDRNYSNITLHHFCSIFTLSHWLNT
uniref:Metalloproteinase inhibitor 2 n=1 Tax=Hucho hucho TaxID=62062 RepID=A0A4W5QT69_9TELE